MAETELTRLLRRRESGAQGTENPAQDSPTGLEGPILRDHDFRTTALPSDSTRLRKTLDNGDPYGIPFKISRVYEIAPVGAGNPVQYVAQPGEGTGIWKEQLDFTARTIMLDNWSNQYVFVSAARKFILPSQVNVVMIVPAGTDSLDLRFIAPGTKVQAAIAGGSFIIVQAFEGLLMPTQGIIAP